MPPLTGLHLRYNPHSHPSPVTSTHLCLPPLLQLLLKPLLLLFIFLVHTLHQHTPPWRWLRRGGERREGGKGEGGEWEGGRGREGCGGEAVCEAYYMYVSRGIITTPWKIMHGSLQQRKKGEGAKQQVSCWARLLVQWSIQYLRVVFMNIFKCCRLNCLLSLQATNIWGGGGGRPLKNIMWCASKYLGRCMLSLRKR